MKNNDLTYLTSFQPSDLGSIYHFLGEAFRDLPDLVPPPPSTPFLRDVRGSPRAFFPAQHRPWLELHVCSFT